jgi:osmoprotectant transport system permease protein
VGTIESVIDWFSQPEQWSGSGSIPVRLWEHLQLSLIAVGAALIPAVILGLYIGHKRRFEFVTITVANLGRALPSFAILALFFPIQLQLGLGLSSWATLAALFLLAIPPILTNTYVGVREVDRDAVESATGMGLTGGQILRSIELPLAAPLIVAGIRTSTVQVIATATLASLIAGGGLGRYITDGFSLGEGGRAQVLGGAILVALLAIVAELGLGAVERAVRPRTASRQRKVRRFGGPGPVAPPEPVGN